MKEVINTVRAVLMFTLLVIILVFCFQNMQDVDIQFFTVQIQSLPLFIALIGTLAMGLLIGFLAGLIKGSRNKTKAVEQARQKQRLKDEKQRQALEKPSDETKRPQ